MVGGGAEIPWQELWTDADEPSDIPIITLVTITALREAGALTISLVAEVDGRD